MLAVAFVTVIVIYALFDPATTPFPRCIFLTLTGFQCPGCGSQRAIHALLHLDISAAWRYNALFVLSLPVIASMLAAGILRRRIPRLYSILNSRAMILSTLTLILTWWILRNLLRT